jgi:hypothetical protein
METCDFCLFGLVLAKFKDRELLALYALHQAITYFRDVPSFPDFQVVFSEWVDCVAWVIQNKDDYYLKSVIEFCDVFTARRHHEI